MAKKGEKMSREYRTKISNANKGKKRSDSVRRERAEITKKLWDDPNYREHMKKSHKGQKPWSDGKHRVDMQGNKHWNWKGGITPQNIRLRGCLEYKLWRTAVFQRDNYTCMWCGARNGNGKKVILNADHIKPWCDYPELRFALDNGRTLCKPCHFKTYKYHGSK